MLIDQIFILRQVLEETHEYGWNRNILHTHFNRFENRKAVGRKALFVAIEEFKIPSHLKRLTKKTIKNTHCKEKVQNKISHSFRNHMGLHQGNN